MFSILRSGRNESMYFFFMTIETERTSIDQSLFMHTH
jgi:hypothetical protein